MVADIARVTYDLTRQYRSLVYQQGRVTLEADNNEAAMLASEALRLETIDIIGPAGTSDDGYAVSSIKGGVTIGKGTFYLGGWRLELDAPHDLSTKPVDRGDFKPGAYVVALLVTEQSVCAVEDHALREVALGGPDSGARTRLMQSFPLISTDGATCTLGASSVATLLKTEGVTIDGATYQLIPSATLQAGFVPGPSTVDPCTPAAAGGYLGADNQMVRVTVTQFSGRTGTLLWGWNNASLLYRASYVNPTTLNLLSTPVDQEHAPQQKQVVEILRTELVLGNNNFVAAGQGFVTSVAQGYAAGSPSIVLTDGLPAEYQNNKDPLFVRLWQSSVNFVAGQPQALDDVSGITVTIAMTATIATPPAAGTIAARPFWRFAVRPSAPTKIFPHRYGVSPQPPDGPRQWITDLAVIGANADGAKLLANCRPTFQPLTKLEECGCCSLVLDHTKDWLSTLNEAMENNSSLNVCFQAGTFTVPSKIVFSNKSVRMTGAGFGTRLIGANLEAVLEFDNCPDINLSDFCVSAGAAGYSASNSTVGLQGAVTIRDCNQVDVERMLMTCANADLRSASCLTIYNKVVSDPPAQYRNARILNCRFEPGNSQVGVLLVNADRAQVEGNVIVTTPVALGITLETLSQHKLVALRLRKQLLHSLTLTNTAPPITKKAKARLRRRQAAHQAPAPGVSPSAALAPSESAAPPAPAPTPSAGAPAAATPAPGATPAKRAATRRAQAARATSADNVASEEAPATAASPAPAPALATPHVNLGLVGLAHIRATFGAIHLSFLSSNQLTDAWTAAIRSSPLTATSTMGAIHRTVLGIAKSAVLNPQTASPAFRNWIVATLPELYSTSSQGIVVGGDFANDVRILNNTVDGMAQGIHVGLSDIKKYGKHPPHLSATRVQIRGNTINIRITRGSTVARHGIFLGGVNSGLVADNRLQCFPPPKRAGQDIAKQAGQDVDAIKVAGVFGQSLIIERNDMLGFTTGVRARATNPPPPPNLRAPARVLWIAAENASETAHQFISDGIFVTANNIP
jgi:hypothetical protein